MLEYARKFQRMRSGNKKPGENISGPLKNKFVI
jgi:hypothetical protein